MSIERRRPSRLAFAACVTLLLTYTALAWAAARRQSPAFDEPYHAVSAWVQLRRRDYRIDNEDPPLWQYWAALPNGPAALRVDPADPRWRAISGDVQLQWPWCVRALYRTPGIDFDGIVRRSRAMMLAVAVALGVLIAAWAWRTGGPVAAVAAAGLFCLDPNFLGHGPLVKNDVAFTLAWTGLLASLTWVGRRVTIASVAAVAASAAVMLTTKFSGLIVVPVLPLMLGLRAGSATPWVAFGRELKIRSQRVLLATAVSLVVGMICWAGIWAAYGFRYSATADPAVRLNLAEVADRAAENAAFVRGGGPAVRPPLARAAMAASAHHLVPEAYAAGFLFTYANNLVRPAYLLGRVSLTGWWDYFPLAMAFKTPVATLAAVAAGLVAVARRRDWATVVLVVPTAVFLTSAMSSNLNIGLRHVLPAYPPLFVAAGWGAAGAWRRWPRAGRTGVAVLAVGLAVEATAAFPNYVSFFNAPASAAGRGGFDLLGDSNLDWGQGLIALRDWQAGHAGEPLFLSYFGFADPRALGIRYTPMPGGYRYDAPPLRFPDASRPCWVAVSATTLQGTQVEDPRLRAYYRRLATRLPDAVLGGSIDLFRYDPRQPAG